MDSTRRTRDIDGGGDYVEKFDDVNEIGAGTGSEETESGVDEGARDMEGAVHAQDKEEPQADVAPPPSGPKAELSTKWKTIIVLTLCLCTFLAALDQTIITTAIPVIAGQFESASSYTWIGSAYLLPSAAFLPSWGKFSDIWGRKPMLLTACGIFLVGSALCAGAQNIAMMIVGRVVQGVAAGGMLGLVNVAVSDLVAVRERGLYLSYLGLTWALASAIGPVIGGALTATSSHGWRYTFVLNFPMGGIAVLGLMLFLHLNSPKISLRQGLKRVDWAGTLTIVGGVVLLLIALEFGGIEKPWNSATVICLLIFGCLLLIVFVVVEWKFAIEPIMPLRLFTKQTNIFCYLVGFTHGFLFMGGSWFLPLYFQSTLDSTPLMAGVYVLPYVVTLSVMSGVTGLIISKTGRYQEVLWAGAALQAIGHGLFVNLPPSVFNWPKIVLYQIIAGVGCGPLFQSPLIAVQATLEPRDIAVATATFAFVRNIGTALAISIGLVVFQNAMETAAASRFDVLGPDAAALISGGSASASVEVVKKLPTAQRVAAQAAYGEGMKAVWWFFFAISVLCALFSLGVGRHHLTRVNNSMQPAMKRGERKKMDSAEKV